MGAEPQHQPPSGPVSTMRSLERAIDVLEVLDGSRQPLRLTEIAKRAGLHVATAQRILGVLEARGRVERDHLGYRPGVALLFGSHAYLLTSPLVAAARPVLQELAAQTTLTASLFVRSGWSRAVVARVEGSSPLRYALPPGERLPLTLGAGKVLAAWMAADEQADLLEHDGPVVTAAGDHVSPEALLADLQAIREQGYSHSQSERAFGISSVAAPVLDHRGTCVAGVQLAGNLTDLPAESVPEVSVEVRRAAQAVADRLT